MFLCFNPLARHPSPIPPSPFNLPSPLPPPPSPALLPSNVPRWSVLKNVPKVYWDNLGGGGGGCAATATLGGGGGGDPELEVAWRRGVRAGIYKKGEERAVLATMLDTAEGYLHVLALGRHLAGWSDVKIYMGVILSFRTQ